MTELVDRILRAGLASEIKGCSPDEVRQIEEHCGVRLPSIYRDFLLQMGHGAGMFFQGSDVFLPALLDLREAASELLEESGAAVSLPADAFVFLMHQGYEFLYFRVSEGDDPPVYFYLEGESAPEKKWPSFSAFLASSLDDHESAART
jgi:SMI1/KNR4 family protein SUKH-1